MSQQPPDEATSRLRPTVVHDPQLRGRHVLVINPAGTAGKTTVSALVIHPRFGGGPILTFDDTNQDARQLYGVDVKKFVHQLFIPYVEHIAERGASGQNTVTDLGASAYEKFLDALRQTGAVDLYDYVVFVVDEESRSQRDAVESMEDLLEMGLDPSKVRFVLNKAEPPKASLPIAVQYSTLCTSARLHNVRVNENCYIERLPVFAYLHRRNVTWQELIEDKADHKGAIRATRGQGLPESRVNTQIGEIGQKMRDAAIRQFDRAFLELDIGPVAEGLLVPTEKT